MMGRTDWPTYFLDLALRCARHVSTAAFARPSRN